MKKRIHDHLIDYYKEFVPRYSSEYFERLRQTDKVVIWLTAISTASIALLITNSDAISIANIYYLKATVAFLLLSVISGVVYRTYLYPLEQLHSNAFVAFEAYCHGASLEPDGPRELYDTDQIEDIAKYLKEDMGLDYDHWLPHDYLDRDFWVEHYNRWSKHWSESESEGLKSLGRAMAPLFNKKPEDTENIFINAPETTVNRSYARCILICTWSYRLLMSFFALSVFTIGLGYILA